MSNIELMKDVKSLFSESFDRDVSLDFLNWRYLDNPFNKILFKTHYESECLQASYSVSPTKILVDSKQFDSAISMTTMTHPAARGRGLFPKLAAQLFEFMSENDFKLVYAFPNDMSHRTFIEKLDWQDIYEIPTMVLRDVSKRKLEKFYEDNVVRDDQLELNYDNLAVQSKIVIKKDSSYLKWRYLKNPNNSYQVFAIQDKSTGKVRSTFITKPYSDSIDIVDMQPANEEDGQILLSNVIDYFSSEGAKSFSVWCPTHHFMHKIIEKLGFKNESPITYFCGKQLNTFHTKAAWEDYRSWYIQMGDSDVY